MTNPFVINDYFKLLKKLLSDLQLNDRPSQIWNLDETSLCIDPSKIKVVGAKVLENKRPILIIYDGHSTHVNHKVVKLAQENNLTILKLSPHTSHFLQPLDLVVFKSFKTAWDEKLVAWQKENQEVKLPKESHFKKTSDVLFKDSHIEQVSQDNIQPEPSKVLFEELLLQTVKQNATNNHKAKKRRVATGAEVITHKNLDDLHLVQNNKPSAKAITKKILRALAAKVD
ncbi:hypothetical protein ILUMI_18215 [Ignelater luminosus]|uniref:DDE-1 domain-containing protein n=1 Tax=Ignelater luminosus TaxID=2038154 RepID=A0A8K0CP13_IGNLU|nr:hypothetical protein ILUMI_18215 [Ignelater luminosus]